MRIDPRILRELEKADFSQLPKVLASSWTMLGGDPIQIRNVLQAMSSEWAENRLAQVEDLGALIDINLPGPFDEAIKKQIGEYLRPQLPGMVSQFIGEWFTDLFLTPS